jgi:hypothetical protein
MPLSLFFPWSLLLENYEILSFTISHGEGMVLLYHGFFDPGMKNYFPILLERH